MDGLHRISELTAPTRLHLDERDQSVSLRYQIDIAVAASEPSLEHTPPPPPKPPLGHPLANLAEFLPCRGHGANVGQVAPASVIERTCIESL